MKRASSRAGRWYSRKVRFRDQRTRAIDRCKDDACQVCHTNLKVPLSPGTFVWNRHVDHVIPERFCRRFFKGADPHIDENLLVICMECHGKKTQAESWLFSGDWLSFTRVLNIIGYDIELVKTAMGALSNSAAGRNLEKIRKK